MLLPYIVLASHVLFVWILLSVIFRTRASVVIGRHAVLLSFLSALTAVGGSLFYSEVVGFEPCTLCWWQRVFIFPLAIIFLAALLKKLNNVFIYAVPLALLALAVSGYHTYFELGGAPLLSCTAEGGGCDRVYIREFGYITIPTMSLTISLFILLFAWAHRIYKSENI